MSIVKRQLSYLLLGLYLFLIMMITSCGNPPSPEDPVEWTPLPELTIPPRATFTSAPQAVSSPQPIFCADGARFLEDLSYPDGSLIEPGVELEKRWSVQNSGTCDWGPGYRLVHVGTDPFTAPREIALYPASSGADAVWRVVLVAPSSPGDYISRWQAQNPEGEPFGDEVYLLVVIPTPTRTPTITPTATP